MAKKIRFSLEMEEGVEVRSLEELRENFSLERVLGYLTNGKLLIWLRDRYEDDIADEIENMNLNDKQLQRKICEIFNVAYVEKTDIDIERVKERNKKISILKEYTTEQKYFDVIDNIAFNQDDLYDLLDENQSTIYLCGEKFNVPISKKGITYIGINNPVVYINSKVAVNFEILNIKFFNIKFNDEYQKVIGFTDINEAEKLYIDCKIDEALPIFLKLAHGGNGRAMYYLGEIYFNGYGHTIQNEKESMQWRYQGYLKGDVLATINYAFTLNDKEKKKKIVLEQLNKLKKLSESNVVAKYELGCLYRESTYVQEDISTYVSLINECANDGFWVAMDLLGYMYSEGKWIDQDNKIGMEWYRKAAEKGVGNSANELGMGYFNGIGVEKDKLKENYWLLKGAELGNKDAQWNYAINCRDGWGVEKNLEKAFYYFSLAAKQGHISAENEVGEAYLEGKGVEKNYSKAVECFKKAAEGGCSDSQNMLGTIYEKGEGLEKDIEKAFFWYCKAAEQNHEKAIENLKLLCSLEKGEDNFLTTFNGKVIYYSIYTEEYVNTVCDLYVCINEREKKLLFSDKCKTSINTSVNSVSNNDYLIVGIQDAYNAIILQIENNKAREIDKWAMKYGHNIYMELRDNELEYGVKDIIKKQCRNKVYL